MDVLALPPAPPWSGWGAHTRLSLPGPTLGSPASPGEDGQVFGLYVFSFVIGTAFLLLSLFGDAFDADADADLDLDGDAIDSAAFKLFSIRSVVYAMFGFGSVGTVLSMTTATSLFTTLAFALVGGAASGALITALFHFVKDSEPAGRASDASWAGLLGTLSLPIEGTGTGQVLVEMGGRSHKLLARAHASVEDAILERGSRVMVIEVDRGVAMVQPAGPDLLTEPSPPTPPRTPGN